MVRLFTGGFKDNLSAEESVITIGVPQWSILEPLSFIISINDTALSSELFEFITYANDTTLTSTLNNCGSPDDRTKSNNINI